MTESAATVSDLTCDVRARRARKRPVLVNASFASGPGELATREGAVKYAEGDALLQGAAGDRWPVPRERFDASYDPVPPLRRGIAGCYRKRPDTVLARRMDAPFHVALPGNRGTLAGDAGDWLVQYAPGDLAVVGSEIFAQTYELL
jgi:hypothetical protein